MLLSRGGKSTASTVRWALLAVLVAVNVGLFLAARDDLDSQQASQERLVPSAAPATPSPTSSPVSTLVGPPEGPRALLLSGSAVLANAAAAELSWRTEVVDATSDSFTLDGGARAGDLILGVRARDDLAGFDHVVVQGGAGDVDVDLDVLETAVLHLLDEVLAKVGPDTTVTLVGPVPDGTDGIAAVNEALSAAAEARDVAYVDPVDAGWAVTDDDLGQEVADALAAATGSAASAPPAS